MFRAFNSILNVLGTGEQSPHNDAPNKPDISHIGDKNIDKPSQILLDQSSDTKLKLSELELQASSGLSLGHQQSSNSLHRPPLYPSKQSTPRMNTSYPHLHQTRSDDTLHRSHSNLHSVQSFLLSGAPTDDQTQTTLSSSGTPVMHPMNDDFFHASSTSLGQDAPIFSTIYQPSSRQWGVTAADTQSEHAVSTSSDTPLVPLPHHNTQDTQPTFRLQSPLRHGVHPSSPQLATNTTSSHQLVSYQQHKTTSDQKRYQEQELDLFSKSQTTAALLGFSMLSPSDLISTESQSKLDIAEPLPVLPLLPEPQFPPNSPLSHPSSPSHRTIDSNNSKKLHSALDEFDLVESNAVTSTGDVLLPPGTVSSGRTGTESRISGIIAHTTNSIHPGTTSSWSDIQSPTSVDFTLGTLHNLTMSRSQIPGDFTTNSSIYSSNIDDYESYLSDVASKPPASHSPHSPSPSPFSSIKAYIYHLIGYLKRIARLIASYLLPPLHNSLITLGGALITTSLARDSISLRRQIYDIRENYDIQPSIKWATGHKSHPLLRLAPFHQYINEANLKQSGPHTHSYPFINIISSVFSTLGRYIDYLSLRSASLFGTIYHHLSSMNFTRSNSMLLTLLFEFIILYSGIAISLEAVKKVHTQFEQFLTIHGSSARAIIAIIIYGIYNFHVSHTQFSTHYKFTRTSLGQHHQQLVIYV